jgi:hypothetical protein
MALVAMAWGSTSGGTRLGPRAFSAGIEKARATPRKAATAIRAGNEAVPVQVSRPRAAAQPSCRVVVRQMIRRRSKRSAAQPVTKVRTNSGRNCAKPTKPNCKAASLVFIVARARS